jgi:hypothetical protein
MKTSELIGPALDWAVAKCEKTPVSDSDLVKLIRTMDCYKASTNWSQGGPIIEREEIEIGRYYNLPDGQWYAEARDGTYRRGPTPLIAAMRCYVASKLGDEIEIPEELQ